MLIWDDGSLEILNATKSDEGSYTCYAENDRGKSNSTGTLTITGQTKFKSCHHFILLLFYEMKWKSKIAQLYLNVDI